MGAFSLCAALGTWRDEVCNVRINVPARSMRYNPAKLTNPKTGSYVPVFAYLLIWFGNGVPEFYEVVIRRAILDSRPTQRGRQLSKCLRNPSNDPGFSGRQSAAETLGG